MTTWRLQYLISCGLALSLFSITSLAVILTERPLPNDYTNAVTIGTWCGKAVEERGIAVGDNSAFLPKVSSQQGIVINAKQNIQSRYPNYVKPVSDVLSVLQSSGVSGLIWSNDVVFLTYCGLAANAIDETPYFGLQYPNATGGWQNVRVMITNLCKTLGQNSFVSPGTHGDIHRDGYASGYETQTPDWNDAKAEAASYWTVTTNTDTLGSTPFCYYYSCKNISSFYYTSTVFWARTFYLKPLAVSVKTNFSKTVSWYCMTSIGTPNGAVSSNLFDSNGQSFTDGNYFLFDSVTAGNTNAVPASLALGGSDNFAIPNACAEPPADGAMYSYGSVYARGWYLKKVSVILQWNITNGFQYK